MQPKLPSKARALSSVQNLLGSADLSGRPATDLKAPLIYHRCISQINDFIARVVAGDILVKVASTVINVFQCDV